jgi:hypothetical protein
MLSFIAAGLVLLSIAAIAAVLIGTASGVGPHNGFSQGVWPTILVLPDIALPLAFLVFIAVIVVSWVKRGRANRKVQS